MKYSCLLLMIFIAGEAFCQNRYRVELVRDINFGTESSYPNQLTVLNNQMVFSAVPSVNGRRLWVTDGTNNGTRFLKDVDPTATMSGGQPLPRYGNQLIFSGEDNIHGAEPWVTDGTTNGTYLISDVKPVNMGSNYGCNPRYFIEYNNKVYFSAQVWSGEEVYVTDGTDTGTHMLKNIGHGDAYPSAYLVYNGKLYFSAKDSVHIGQELWCTDGTPGGTYMVKEIRNGNDGSNPSDLTEFKGKIYFRAEGDNTGSELYVSDGTSQGTKLFCDINKAPNGWSQPGRFTILGNLLLFSASDGNTGVELWCTDGDTVFRIKDLNPSGDGTTCSGGFHKYQNKLFFGGAIDGSGCQLFVTDGTEAGTHHILSRDGERVEDPTGFINWDGKFFFTAGQYNHQLWMSDGTSFGTFPVLPDSTTKWDALAGNLQPLLFNNEIYFSANYSNTIGTELYKLKMDSAATAIENESILNDIEPVVYPNPFSNSFNISIANNNLPVQITVTDMAGRIVANYFQTTATKQYAIDVMKGIYFLRIQQGNSSSMHKIIKSE